MKSHVCRLHDCEHPSLNVTRAMGKFTANGKWVGMFHMATPQNKLTLQFRNLGPSGLDVAVRIFSVEVRSLEIKSETLWDTTLLRLPYPYPISSGNGLETATSASWGRDLVWFDFEEDARPDGNVVWCYSFRGSVRERSGRLGQEYAFTHAVRFD